LEVLVPPWQLIDQSWGMCGGGGGYLPLRRDSQVLAICLLLLRLCQQLRFGGLLLSLVLVRISLCRHICGTSADSPDFKAGNALNLCKKIHCTLVIILKVRITQHRGGGGTLGQQSIIMSRPPFPTESPSHVCLRSFAPALLLR